MGLRPGDGGGDRDGGALFARPPVRRRVPAPDGAGQSSLAPRLQHPRRQGDSVRQLRQRIAAGAYRGQAPSARHRTGCSHEDAAVHVSTHLAGLSDTGVLPRIGACGQGNLPGRRPGAQLPARAHRAWGERPTLQGYKRHQTDEAPHRLHRADWRGLAFEQPGTKRQGGVLHFGDEAARGLPRQSVSGRGGHGLRWRYRPRGVRRTDALRQPGATALPAGRLCHY